MNLQVIIVYPYNLEINKNSVPSGTVDLFAGQIANNPAISNPFPQPAQMAASVSRSDLVPGNKSRIKESHFLCRIRLTILPP